MNQDILERYFRGRTSEEENRQIGAWLLSGPDAMKEFGKVKFISEGITLYGHRDSELSGKAAFVLKTRRILRWAAAAACLILLLAGTVFLVRYRTIEELSSEMISFQTAPGQKVDITLADGSTVSLNSCSRIEYPVTFRGRERHVSLHGEALFRVKQDKERPFIVSTFAADLEVKGTTFGVNADEEEQYFSTTLLEGSVMVTNLADPTDVHLMHPSDVLTLTDGKLCRSVLTDYTPLLWTEGLVNLEARDFTSLMKKFEKAYGVQIVSRANPSIQGLSGELRISEGIEHALKVLQHVVDFRYEVYESIIIIKE